MKLLSKKKKAVTCPLCIGSEPPAPPLHPPRTARRVERCGLRRAAKLGFTPHASHAVANARYRRVPHRAPALRSHRTAQSVMHVRHAHRREGIFDPFGPPKLGRGWPSRGFAVLQLVLVWQAKKQAEAKKAAKEAQEKAAKAAQVPTRAIARACARAHGGGRFRV